MNTQSGSAEVNGAHLYYEVAGSGHPLVLVHGFTLDTRMWDDQFAAFAKQSRVIRYDARGFGRSSLPYGQPYSHAADLKALLDFFNTPQAVVLGLSMGGRIAFDFALSYPRATTALIPVDSGMEGFQRAPEVLAERKVIDETAVKSGVAAARELWFNAPLFRPAMEQPGVAARLKEIIGEYSGWHWQNPDSHCPAMPPAFQRVEQLGCPTLVIVGQRDLPDYHKVADLVQKRAPNACAAVIPGVGHMSNMEAPQRFNQVVLDYLCRLQ